MAIHNVESPLRDSIAKPYDMQDYRLLRPCSPRNEAVDSFRPCKILLSELLRLCLQGESGLSSLKP